MVEGIPPGSFLSGLVGGLLGVGVVNVLVCAVFTWAHCITLHDHEVDGRELGTETLELLGSHLQIYALLLTAAFVAIISGNRVLIAVAVWAGLRTLDLEARAIHHVTGVSMAESYKIAVVLFLVLLGPSADRVAAGLS